MKVQLFILSQWLSFRSHFLEAHQHQNLQHSKPETQVICDSFLPSLCILHPVLMLLPSPSNHFKIHAFFVMHAVGFPISPWITTSTHTFPAVTLPIMSHSLSPSNLQNNTIPLCSCSLITQWPNLPSSRLSHLPQVTAQHLLTFSSQTIVFIPTAGNSLPSHSLHLWFTSRKVIIMCDPGPLSVDLEKP